MTGLYAFGDLLSPRGGVVEKNGCAYRNGSALGRRRGADFSAIDSPSLLSTRNAY
jgi:hypothetical protein